MMSSTPTNRRNLYMHSASGQDMVPGEAEALADLIEEEIRLLVAALPDALARQWLPSPVPRPRFDTAERASGDHSDPTADIVTDPRRLAVRRVVQDAELALRETAARVERARRGLERAVRWYDGEDVPSA